MKNIILALGLTLITACGSGSSDSGGIESITSPGQNLPAKFVGVYNGSVNLKASALGFSESDSFPITITVMADGTVRFDGDEPDETFTVGITDAGDFSGSISINEDPCAGTLAVVGKVDGNNASGTVEGTGDCDDGAIKVSVDLEGDFTAAK